MLELSILAKAGIRIDESKWSLDDAEDSGLFDIKIRPLAIAFPKNKREVLDILSVCQKEKISVYPVSTGNNWGYGASAPTSQNNLLMNLKDMNQIFSFDEERGTVEVGPGVTQGQLADFIKESKWVLDCTGAGPDTSIVGNILERGFGHGRKGDRSRYYTITEAILANGKVLNLDQHLSYVGRAGLAAGLHEMFSQNNLAVITKIKFELNLKAEESLRLLIRIPHRDHISEYVDALSQLKAEGTVDSFPHIGNEYRVLGMFETFNFQKWSPETGVPGDELKTLLNSRKIAPWSGVMVIAGNRKVALAMARRVRDALKEVAKVTIFSAYRLNRLNNLIQKSPKIFEFIPKFRAAKEFLDNFSLAMKSFEGPPTLMGLKGCYWRNPLKDQDMNGNPVKNGCGFFWLAPALPMSGNVVSDCLNESRSKFEAMGFEFSVTLTAASSHLCQAIISIYYNKLDPDETNRARDLANTLRADYEKKGWIRYRRGIDEMPIPENDIESDALYLRSVIKRALDPENIISPGRYQKASPKNDMLSSMYH